MSQVFISGITNNSVDISCYITDNGNSTIDTIGFCWSTDALPTIDDDNYAMANSNSIEYQISGLIPKTKYYLRSFALNEKGFSYGLENSFTTEPNETDIFIDSRDGKEYKTVKIGDQWWFAENLNYYTGNDSWYFNDDSLNFSAYGRLYTIESALKAVPEGWRLASETDWRKIERELGLSLEDIYAEHWRGFVLAKYLWNNAEFDFGIVWNGIRDTSYSVLYYNDGSAYFWTSSEYIVPGTTDTLYYVDI